MAGCRVERDGPLLIVTLDRPEVRNALDRAASDELDLALACDIIVAAEHAELGFPEPRVGRMALEGGMHRLARHVPLKIAMGLLLTGRRISAPEAYRAGLVNEVV